MVSFELRYDFDKEYFLKSFLDTVYSISNKEYQKRVWIEAIGPEVDSFDETYISFRDCDFILEHAKEFGLLEKQGKLLIKLRDIFLEFGKENDWPPFFIETEEWTKITEMAKEVLKAFDY